MIYFLRRSSSYKIFKWPFCQHAKFWCVGVEIVDLAQLIFGIPGIINQVFTSYSRVSPRYNTLIPWLSPLSRVVWKSECYTVFNEALYLHRATVPLGSFQVFPQLRLRWKPLARGCFPSPRRSWTEEDATRDVAIPGSYAHFESTVRYTFQLPVDKHSIKSRQLSRMAIFRMISAFSGWSQWGPISLLRDVACFPEQIWSPNPSGDSNIWPPSTRECIFPAPWYTNLPHWNRRCCSGAAGTLLLILTNFIRLMQIDTQSTTSHRNYFQLDVVLLTDCT